MAKRAKTTTDFTILKADFTAAAQALQHRLRALQERSGRRAEDKAELDKASEKTVRAFLDLRRKERQQEETLCILFRAADNGDTKTLKQAFTQGVDVNFLNRGGWSLLSYATASGKEKAVDFLLEQGADVNLKKGISFSPIEMATIKDNKRLFNKLAKAGAQVDRKALIKLAKQNDSAEVLKLLKKRSWSAFRL